jgi:hypothetical protein
MRVAIKRRLASRMISLRLPLGLALAAALLLGGCSEVTTREVHNLNLSKKKHIFVEHRLADSLGVSDEITRQLKAMGYDVSTGAITMMPPGTDFVVTYDDMWTWDFTSAMIEIDIQLRTAGSDKIVAMGHYFQPTTVFGHPPSDMIHELLVKLFKQA